MEGAGYAILIKVGRVVRVTEVFNGLRGDVLVMVSVCTLVHAWRLTNINHDGAGVEAVRVAARVLAALNAGDVCGGGDAGSSKADREKM